MVITGTKFLDPNPLGTRVLNKEVLISALGFANKLLITLGKFSFQSFIEFFSFPLNMDYKLTDLRPVQSKGIH